MSYGFRTHSSLRENAYPVRLMSSGVAPAETAKVYSLKLPSYFGQVFYQKPTYYYPSQFQQTYYFPQVTTVTPAPVQYKPPVAAQAPVTVPAAGGKITNPLNNSNQPKDNPLNWGLYTQDKSALYPAEPLANPNLNFRSLAIGINKTGISKGQNYYLDNPIFDLMNFNHFFCYKAARIPIENATVMADCLKDSDFEPTAAKIKRQFREIVENTNNTENGVYFILYSGHGARSPGGKEADGKQGVLVGQDVELIKDTEVFETLGAGLNAGREGFLILDSCYSGEQNWPFVVSAKDMQIKVNDEKQGELTDKGHTKVFMTSSKEQTSADGIVGEGGAGSQALRYALVKHGMRITNQQVLETTSSWLKARGYTQTPSIQSSHPFKMSDTFFSEAVIAKLGQLERSIEFGALAENEDIRPQWQHEYLKQAMIAAKWQQHAQLLSQLADVEKAIATLNLNI